MKFTRLVVRGIIAATAWVLLGLMITASEEIPGAMSGFLVGCRVLVLFWISFRIYEYLDYIGLKSNSFCWGCL